MYTPCKILLSWWLPQYEISIKYLAILLPVCVFDGKMQMLSNTYMKVYRKERQLLYINIISMGVSFILAIIGTYCIKNMYFVIVGMLIAIIMRSSISEIYLSKILKTNMRKEIKLIIMEITYSVLFIIISFNMSVLYAFLFNILVYIIYLVILKDNTKFVIINILNKVKRYIENII